MHRTRIVAILALAAVAASPWPAAPPAKAGTGEGPASLRVMTRNVYLGADLGAAMIEILQDPEATPAVVGQVWADLHATDFAVRAEALAAEIEAAGPDLVGLQEVALWRFQSPADSLSERPRPARKVEFDFLKSLLKALKRRGLRYRAASVAEAFDVEMPGFVDGALVDVRFTDRNVILARNGVPATRRDGGTFEAGLPLPIGGGLTLVDGWTSVEAKVDGRRFLFVNAHLVDGVEDLQRAQLAELLAGPAASDLPVVLVGDFNSDPANGYAPLVHADAVGAGWIDSWTEARPGEPGLTWGHAALLDNAAADFAFRLDYVFHGAGLAATAADILGEEASDRSGGLWPSDHAGLVVDLTIL